MRTFVISFYFGSVSKSGSAKAKVPAPTGSGSTTLLKTLHIPSPSRADIKTLFHIGMDRNFVCLWRRHNCISQVIEMFMFIVYEINYWVFKEF